MMASDLFHLGLLLSMLMVHLAGSNTVPLQAHNIDDILNHNELVLINFFADWCRFSQMLKPIYEETAKKIAEEYPESGKVVLGAVDCDRETVIAKKFQVSKYPTLKLFRYGQQIKREYRGQRSVDAMANFIRDQLKDPVIRYDNLDALDDIDTKKTHLIGYFSSDDGVDYHQFLKVGSMLRDDCQSHAVIGEAAEKERLTGNKIVFRPSGDLATDMLYTGPIEDYNILLKWATDKCVPLVREITFENAEELTEEGLPFMILFHHIDDTDTPEKFKKTVAKELLGETHAVNFLTANGEKFSHPLFHLGKSTSDLPVLAIDSFRHMYLWKHDPKTDIDSPGLIKQFVEDLHSGKLHREFHHGPDPTQKTAETPNGDDGGEGDSDGAVAPFHHGGHGNVAQFNVQHQVIIHSNGMRMQVIRFVQIGKQQPIDLREHLAAINANGLFGDHHNDNDHHGENHEAVIKDENDSQKESMFHKVISDFIGNDDHDDEDDEEDDGGGLGNESDGEAAYGGKESNSPEMADNKLDRKNVNQQETGEINSDGFYDRLEQEKNRHHGHGGHHHGGLRRTDGTKPTEVTTKSYTRVTRIEMKIDEDDIEEDDGTPPSSIFRKLAPSRDRYTLLRDEL